MTKVILLERLRDFTRDSTGEIIMPTAPQKGEAEKQCRAAEVHLMRLPDSSAAKKKAPYILHQVITGKDAQPSGNSPESSVNIRTIFCVYNDNEEEGGLMLLNLMETLRIDLMRHVIIGRQFELDLEAGIETLVYPEPTAPFYAGEMITAWKLPTVEREVFYERQEERRR